MIMHRRGCQAAGQSIVEVIVALGILVTAVAASLTLTTAAVNSQTENGSRMVATNLAREGIEVARNIRDSNWLAGDEWDDGLYDIGGDYTAIPVFDPADGSWEMEFGVSAITSNRARVYRFTANYIGMYVQRLAKPSSTVITPFRRLVTLQPVCRGGDVMNEGEECTPADPKVAIQVTSKVAWFTGGRDRQITLEETIYDWR